MEDPDFYEDLERGNAVVYQQARNNIMLAITSKITNSILAGDNSDKVAELMQLLKNLKAEEIQ